MCNIQSQYVVRILYYSELQINLIGGGYIRDKFNLIKK